MSWLKREEITPQCMMPIYHSIASLLPFYITPAVIVLAVPVAVDHTKDMSMLFEQFEGGCFLPSGLS